MASVAEEDAPPTVGFGEDDDVVEEGLTASGFPHTLEHVDNLNFSEQEEATLAYWNRIQAFETSLRLSEGRPLYTFYDGPPFLSGKPHYGHLLAGTIKDVVTRYAHQTGHYVPRVFGWDCHGLPIEYEIDQTLGITDRNQVLQMGIRAYNDECRKIVSRYEGEWRGTVNRLGRWIDMDNAYKTMNADFMESVWHVFSKLYEKGLVYRGFKVMPYSTACCTPLSNFEAGQNYKMVDDPAVTVLFRCADEENAFFVAWTTTPWTLPSNLSLGVNPDLEYCKIRDVASDRMFYVLKDLLPTVYPQMKAKKWKPSKAAELYEVLSTFPGAELVDRPFEPLFPYFAERYRETAFRVIGAAYVTADSGTGIVHEAPAFGEDDYNACMASGIITRGETLPCPVDANGRFTSEVPEYEGKHVKEADADICAALKARGVLLSKTTYNHSYPFCWRSDTPLIYKAVPSWFVAVEQIKDRLVANNNETYWVPSFVKEKRFHNWLCEAKDWAISRNRFWGTPIPLWASEDMEEIVVVGSIEELRRLSGREDVGEDLHRENVDDITIPSQKNPGQVLRRIDEVFDCWFESGSMPYAQLHYPFENRDAFENGFPADFIAEGLDQTRGWFYTLMVLSTALYDKPAFKNLIVNGLVLAADGKKMSKRLKNYPDPALVMGKYGSDAMRMYMTNSPVVRAEPLKFREDGVSGVIRDLMLPWFHAFRFFVQNVRRYEVKAQTPFAIQSELAHQSENDLDVWIQAELAELVRFVHQEMEGYRLYTVMPRLVEFTEQLTNWYVRLNRDRLKGVMGLEDSCRALNVLYEVLMTLTLIMAPFTPFFSEYLYQHLRKLQPSFRSSTYGTDGLDSGSGSDSKQPEEQEEDDGVAPDTVGRADSVHYLMLPSYDVERLNADSVRRMRMLEQVVVLARTVRDRHSLSIKRPVRSVVVVCRDASRLDDLRALERYVFSEVNVWNLETTTDEQAWCTLKAVPNFSVLGPRLGKRMRAVTQRVNALTHEQLVQYQDSGSLQLTGVEHNKETFDITLNSEEVEVRRDFSGNRDIYDAEVSRDSTFLVAVDVSHDEAIEQQAIAREFVSRVQKMRKAVGLVIEDRVMVFYSCSSSSSQTEAGAGAGVGADNDEAATAAVSQALAANMEFVAGKLHTPPLHAAARAFAPFATELDRITVELGDAKLQTEIVMTRCTPAFNDESLAAKVPEGEVRKTIKMYMASSAAVPTGAGAVVSVAVQTGGTQEENTYELLAGQDFFPNAVEMVLATQDSADPRFSAAFAWRQPAFTGAADETS